MKAILRNLALGVAVLTLTVTAVSGSSTFSAFAQTTAPSASVPLPEDTIKSLQEALSGQGIAVTASGVLDDGTRAAIRQYQSQHHLPVTGEPDKATLDKLGVGGQASALPEESQGTGEAAPGQAMGGMGPGMMTPQMMQMMQNMMGQGGMGGMMGGMAGQGMPKGGMDEGMMCPMMQMMMGAGGGMGGPGMHLGLPRGSQEEMTPERVRTFVEEHLTRQGNPRLKLGEVATAVDGSITAEIVTVDGSLVQKLAFNRYPGLVRQIVE
jgi:hypothetical protein